MPSETLTLGLPTPPLPQLPPRSRDSHKGTFGHALVLGGSLGMAGSIALTARAAMQTGAGLVTQAVPHRIVDTVAILNPGAMTLPLEQDSEGRVAEQAYAQIEARLAKTTAVACGPGLGRSRSLQTLVRKIVHQVIVPCVVDADALNNLVDSGQWPAGCAGPRVITPHPGEWSRLCGVPASDLHGQRSAAVAFAKKHNLTVVLKGQNTLVTDGHSAYLNDTGTPAMATGGSGDVLTGVITALICQGLAPRDAAQLGVYVHGAAGERAEKELGTRVVLAERLIDYIWGHGEDLGQKMEDKK